MTYLLKGKGHCQRIQNDSVDIRILCTVSPSPTPMRKNETDFKANSRPYQYSTEMGIVHDKRRAKRPSRSSRRQKPTSVDQTI